MWIFTPIGFFSIVRKSGDDDLTVRARVADDLDRLRDDYLPSLSATRSGEGTDYAHRATVSKQALSEAMASIIEGLDYSNFKNEVARRQGQDRAHTYSRVWSTLYGLQSHAC